MLAAPEGRTLRGRGSSGIALCKRQVGYASIERPAGASKKRKIPGAFGERPPDSINQTLKKTRKKRVGFSAEVQCYAFGIGLAAKIDLSGFK
jgi:hypothetical protein